MKKTLMVITGAVVTLGLGAAVLAPTPVYAACDGVQGVEVTACSACEAETGANWVPGAAATTDSSGKPVAATKGYCDRGGKADMTSIIQLIINIMLFIIGVLSVGMIIFGGLRYTTSAGDKGKVDSAKNTIVYAVIGLVVAILAFAIVQWVFGALTTK